MFKRLLVLTIIVLVAACSKQLSTSNQTSTDVAKRVSVSQTKQMTHNAKVILNGKIISDKGGHLYTFDDGTGQIAIEISGVESNIQKFVLNAPVEITGNLDYKPAQGHKLIVTKLVTSKITIDNR